MAHLGYDNVVIRSGDGTQGWRENAPFDVILVAAGGPSVPDPLRRQLALGGRLVIPVGDADEQRLMRVTRSEEHTSELQSLMRISYAVFCLKKKNKDLLMLT